MAWHQLPLAVQLREAASFDSFHAGPNAEAVATLRAGSADVLLYGPRGSGKSHLLHAAARLHGASCVPLDQLGASGADALAGFDAAPALCLDAIDAVAADATWCMAVLRLIDALRARGARLWISAGAAPERLDIALPDLRTRLAACAVFGLKPLSDDDRAELLIARTQARGLELPEDVVRWLLARVPRDTQSLLTVIDALDRASLAQQRRLTLPFTQLVVQPLLQPSLLQ